MSLLPIINTGGAPDDAQQWSTKSNANFNYLLGLIQANSEVSPAAPPIENPYNNLADMIADQTNQTSGFFQFVQDARTAQEVSEGVTIYKAYFEYLGTVGNSIVDYRKLTDHEAQQLVTTPFNHLTVKQIETTQILETDPFTTVSFMYDAVTGKIQSAIFNPVFTKYLTRYMDLLSSTSLTLQFWNTTNNLGLAATITNFEFTEYTGTSLFLKADLVNTINQADIKVGDILVTDVSVGGVGALHNKMAVQAKEVVDATTVDAGKLYVKYSGSFITNVFFNAVYSGYLLSYSQLLATKDIYIKLYNTTSKKSFIAKVLAFDFTSGFANVQLDPVILEKEIEVDDVLLVFEDLDSSYDGSSKMDLGTYVGNASGLKQELEDQINSLSFEGVQSYDTLVDLQAVTPIPVNGTTAKVAKDTANPQNNGNWYVSGGAWVQFDNTVENVVEETNTSKSVSGQAVANFYSDVAKNSSVFHPDATGEKILKLNAFILDFRVLDGNGVLVNTDNYYLFIFKNSDNGLGYKIQLNNESNALKFYTNGNTPYTPPTDYTRLRDTIVFNNEGKIIQLTVNWDNYITLDHFETSFVKYRLNNNSLFSDNLTNKQLEQKIDAEAADVPNVVDEKLIDFKQKEVGVNLFPNPLWKKDHSYIFNPDSNGFDGTTITSITRENGGVTINNGASGFYYRIGEGVYNTQVNYNGIVNFNFELTSVNGGDIRFEFLNNWEGGQKEDDFTLTFLPNEKKVISFFIDFTLPSSKFSVNIFGAGVYNGVVKFGRFLLQTGIDYNIDDTFLLSDYINDADVDIPEDIATEDYVDNAVLSEEINRQNADDLLSQQITNNTNALSNKLEQVNTSNIIDEAITQAKLSQALIDYINASGGGTISNNADDEFLGVNSNSQLTLKTKDTWYLSSKGNDSNNGFFKSKPFLTIAKLQTVLKDGDTVFIEKGSKFYEAFKIDNSVKIKAYGIGENPIISGEANINIPVIVSGNVWQTENTYVGVSGRVMIMENGIPMQPVTTEAECEALPNSYVKVGGDSISAGTYTVKFHTSDSANPNTNGKIYTTNLRDAIVNTNLNQNSVYVDGVDAEYAFDETTLNLAGFKNSYISNCKANWGNKHNVHIAEDSIIDNTIAYGSEIQLGVNNTLFVAYDGSVGLNSFYTIKNSAMIQTISKTGILTGKGTTGVLDHVGAGGGNFNTSNIINCYGYGLDTAVASNAVTSNITNCFFEKLSGKQIFNNANNTNVLNCFFGGVRGVDTTILLNNYKIYNSIFVKLRVSNGTHGNIDIKNTVFFNEYRFSNSNASSDFNVLDLFGEVSTVANIKSFNSVYLFYNFSIVAQENKYDGDYNIFQTRDTGSEIRNKYNGVTYTTLQAWQNATNKDANSLWLTETQARSFYITDINSGDAIINPLASATGADGTIYTGRFPDGSLFSEKLINKSFSYRSKRHLIK